MAYTRPPTYVTGDTFTAANANTYWRDNFIASAPDLFTTAGDMVYATNADVAARLALVVGGILYGASGHPAWLPLPDTGAVLYHNSMIPVWLAAGSTGQFLRAGSTPSWASLIYKRKGGDASYWQDRGSTNYTPSAAHIQAGAGEWTGAAASSGTKVIAFPVSFSATPLVFVNCVDGQLGKFLMHTDSSFITPSQFILSWEDLGSGSWTVIGFNWLAIGPP